MSTEYTILKNKNLELTISEQSSKFSVYAEDLLGAQLLVAKDMETDDLVKMAIKIIQVASYNSGDYDLLIKKLHNRIDNLYSLENGEYK